MKTKYEVTSAGVPSRTFRTWHEVAKTYGLTPTPAPNFPVVT